MDTSNATDGPEQIVAIRVSAPEMTVRQQVKQAGG